MKKISKKSPKVTVMLDHKPEDLLIDTGASVDILDRLTYTRIGSPKLHTKKKIKLAPYGSKPIETLGTCNVLLEKDGKMAVIEFQVVENGNGKLTRNRHSLL